MLWTHKNQMLMAEASERGLKQEMHEGQTRKLSVERNRHSEQIKMDSGTQGLGDIKGIPFQFQPLAKIKMPTGVSPARCSTPAGVAAPLSVAASNTSTSEAGGTNIRFCNF